MVDDKYPWDTTDGIFFTEFSIFYMIYVNLADAQLSFKMVREVMKYRS